MLLVDSSSFSRGPWKVFTATPACLTLMTQQHHRINDEDRGCLEPSLGGECLSGRVEREG